MSPYIVACGGGSGSGKSTVVKLLQKELNTGSTVIELDQYYRDRSHLSLHERRGLNYDHPDAIESELLLQHLDQLLDGKPISYPQYDFATHTRKGHQTLHPAPVLLIDGIFALCDPQIVSRVHLSLYIECDSDIRLARRAQRDAALRGRDFNSVMEQYVKTVKPMHAQHIEPTKYRADLILPWHDQNQMAIEMVCRLITAYQGSQTI